LGDAGGPGWEGNNRLSDARGELATRTGKAKSPVAPGAALCLAEEYQAGVRAIDLAHKYHMHKSTVWRHLARAGVRTGQHFLASNKRLVIEVTALRTAGLTLRQIAVQTGVSRSTVHRLLQV